MTSTATALAMALTLGATPPWAAPPFSADPLAVAQAAARLEAPKDAEVDVLQEEYTVSLDESGRQVWTFRLVFVPRTAAAAEAWASLSMPYRPRYEARPEVRARVISPAGHVTWLEASSLVDGVVDTSGDRIYGDRRVLQGPLPAMEPGATVEEQVVVRELEPFFAAGFVTRVTAARSVPVRALRVRVEAPQALPIRVAVQGLPSATERLQGGVRTFTLEADGLPPAPAQEPGTPPDQAAPRHLSFSTGRSWQVVARAYAELVERQLAGAELAATARTIIGAGDRPVVAAQKVLDWIGGRTRYTGLAFAESGLVPERPAETLRRRFGDCKDLSLLAIGLLRAAGVPASMALLRSSPDEVGADLPGLGLFDHAVVRLGTTPPIWLDPAAGALAGQLGGESQGRLALVADASSTRLVRTPEAGPGDSRVIRRRRIELAEASWARAVETVAYGGAAAVYVRRYATSVPAADVERSDREWLNAREGTRLERTFEPGTGAEAAQLRLEAAASGWGSTGDDTAEAVVGPHAVFRYLPDHFRTRPLEAGAKDEPPRAREHPLRLWTPHRAELHYEVVPPPGFHPERLPEVAGFTVGPATFRAAFAARPDGAVTVTYEFEAGRQLRPSEADRLWREVADRTRLDGPRVTFSRTSQVLLRQGEGRAALDELRRLVKLHPDEARHRNHLALALLQLGMGEAARAEARRAVALDPEGEWTQRVLGLVLQHDLLGRQFARGADLPGALAALRRARALAPGSPLARGMLAMLLLHDEGGGRVGPGPALEEALAELVAIREELRDHGHDEDYAEGLLAAGRASDALQLTREMPAGRRRNAVLLAAALVEGPEAFARELARIPEGDRATAGQGAFLEIVRCRQYAGLASFLTILRRQAAPQASIDLFELLAKVRRHETLALDRRDPAHLPTLLFKALALPNPKEALTELAVGDQPVSAVDAPDLGRTLRAAVGQQFGEVGLDGLVDLALAVTEVTVEGAGPPWRIKVAIRSPGQADQPLNHLYAVREGGLPKLAAATNRPAEVARLALARAKAGDLAGARRLLDWVRGGLPEARPGAPSLAGVAAALWPAGGSNERRVILRAATALAAFAPDQDGASRAGPLDGWREQATGQEWVALAFAALVDTAPRDAARVLSLADELMKAGPEMDAALWWRRAYALGRLGRQAELRQIAQERLASRPDDVVALRVLVDDAARSGDLAAERRLRATLLQQPGADQADWNNSAWSRLYLEPVAPEALDEARRAVSAAKTPSYAELHTLATVEAWSGRPPAEVMKTLQRAIQASGGEVSPSDWLVIGRIAEAYGLPEVAEASYRRLTRPAELLGSSSWELGAQRLRAMGRPVD